MLKYHAYEYQPATKLHVKMSKQINQKKFKLDLDILVVSVHKDRHFFKVHTKYASISDAEYAHRKIFAEQYSLL